MHLFTTYLRTQQARVCGIALLVSVAHAWGQSPPVNDNFANATPIAGSLLASAGTLAGATYESSETNGSYYSSPDGGGSVWWTWTASQSSTVVIEMLRDYSVVNSKGGLYTYTGTNLNALTDGSWNSFNAPPGVT